MNIPLFSADNIEWADKVLGYSSQLGEKKYGAIQVIGPPSVMPDFGFSNCSWTPKLQNSTIDEWIKVAFRKPIRVQQISIAENFNPGAVIKIILYDSLGIEHLVYNKFSSVPIEEKGRMFNVFIPRTPYEVYALKILMDTEGVPGWNQIDAIGISDSNIPVAHKIDIAQGSEITFRPINIGSKVNSPYHELAPVIAPDGKSLYFTRDGHPENIGAERKQDVWLSIVLQDSMYLLPKNMGPPINNELNNYILSITPDGNTMLLGNVYKPTMKAKHGVSMSYFDGEEWSFPEMLQIRDFYNTNKHVAYCLGNDAKTLIMAVEREDTYGDIDLYISFYNDDENIWSTPLNLGPNVNTAAEEASPFLASDGRTLYYSTSGLCGYGNNDIFITRRLDNSWTNWSKPENLGPILNSAGWDAYFTIPASGDYAYFVSTKGSYGNEDIFKVLLPISLRPQPVALVYGRVLNAKTNEPVAAKIVYETLPDGREIGHARSNPKTGVYKIVLPVGQKYGFLAVADSFVAINEHLDLRKSKKYEEILKDLYLVPIEHGQTVSLNNIFFDFAKYELLPESFSELNRVVAFLKGNPDINIELRGHTCDIGSEKNNYVLSNNRAHSVQEYLLSNGIPPERIISKGYGKSMPNLPNTNEENRSKNRRVEFIILKHKPD